MCGLFIGGSKLVIQVEVRWVATLLQKIIHGRGDPAPTECGRSGIRVSAYRRNVRGRESEFPPTEDNTRAG